MRYVNTSHYLAPMGLRIERSTFRCPYCQKGWHRGGKKEGFVKASALQHVHTCWAIRIYEQGYVNGGWENGKIKLYSIAEAKAEFHPSYLRNLKSAIRRRARERGERPRRA